MLFCLPLYTFSTEKFSHRKVPLENLLDEFLIKIVIIGLAYTITTLFLLIYSRMIHKQYQNRVHRDKYILTRTQKVMQLIKERHVFFILAGLAYIIFVYLFFYYFRHGSILSVVIGVALHAFQLIYTNKIRIKKYNEQPNRQRFNWEMYLKINKELAKSPAYMKSLCELSFANILIEIDRA